MTDLREAAVIPLREALARCTARALLVGLAAALLLAVPDLLRQLPVRSGEGGLPAALLVDVVGVLSAAVVQVALVGVLNRGSSLGLLLEAVRRAPGVLLLGLVGAGAVSALLTLVPSVLLLGYDQVLGPLQGPPLSSLLLAQASDVLATAVTAPFFALLVGVVAGVPAARSVSARG